MTGTTTITGVVVAGAGTTHVTGAEIIAGALYLPRGAELLNDGALTVKGSGLISLAEAVIDNAADGTLLLAGDVSEIVANGSGTLTNAGTLVSASKTYANAISATLVNTGVVRASGPALHLTGAVQNSGQMQGAFSFGASVVNSAAGVITGGALAFAGPVSNAGSISGALAFAGSLASTGSLAGTETLSGSGNSLSGQVSGTLTIAGGTTMSGLILGGGSNLSAAARIDQTGAVTLAAGGADRIVVASGGTWAIDADVGLTAATPATAALTVQGTLEKAAGSKTSVVALPVVNDGTVAGLSGDLKFTSAIGGTGAVTIGAGAKVEFAAAVGAGQAVSLAGTGATLKLDDAPAFAGSIAGLSTGGQAVDLADIAYATARIVSWTTSTGGGVLTVTDGVTTASLRILGSYALSNFALQNDGAGHAELTDPRVAALASAAAGLAPSGGGSVLGHLGASAPVSALAAPHPATGHGG